MDTQTTPDTIQVDQKKTTPATSQADQEKTTSSENAATFEVGGNGYTFTEDELQKIENGQRPVLKQQTDEKKSIPSIWDNGFDKGMEANPDMTIYDAIRGYNNYAKENQKEPLDILDIWPLMQSGDIMKSRAQNEKDERKRANKEKWDQVTNALLHLGNFVGTIAGAPSQDIESSLELSKRQQILRDKTLEQRRQANSDFLKIYQASQAEKMAAEKMKLENRKQDRLDAAARTNAAKAEAYINYQRSMQMKNEEQAEYWRVKAECLEKGMPLEEAKKQAEIAATYARAAAATQNAATNAAKLNSVTYKRNADGSEDIIEYRAGTGGGTSAAPANNGGSSSNRGNRGGQSPQITGVNWVN